MMIICAKLILNPTMHYKVMGRTLTGFTLVYAQSLSADCDFDIRPGDMVFICDTMIVMMNICAKLFSNPIMYG